MRSFAVITLLYVHLTCYHASDEHAKGTLIIQVATALKKTALYFNRHYKEMNVDGITGLRFAEGVIHHMMTHNKARMMKYAGLHSKVKRVSLIIDRVGRDAIKRFNRKTNDYLKYYHAFEPIVKKLWHYYKAPSREVNKDLIEAPSTCSYPGGWRRSDYCIINILGSQTSGRRERCSIPDSCWKAVTSKGSCGYYLTHVAIYFLFATRMKCDNVFHRLTGNLGEMYTRLASNLFSQMEANMEKEGTFKDLYLEQSVICSWLGLDSRFNVKWIKEALQWQEKNGCVKDHSDIDKLTVKFLTRTLQSGGVAVKSDGVAVKSDEVSQKSDEVVLDDGCSAHATGLYIAYLADVIDWLITST